MATHCCETMNYWANLKCSEHPDVFACPDNVVFFKSRPRKYGLIVHDDGSSFIEIKFCPWCGSSLQKENKK
ncbi:DUF6980 family protein [Methylobacter tundripaludum]|uniref:DUF6980 family protein n=1 Tax=Methylobacter tundripaludum TaxID=173365 RepID=UPI0009DD3409